MDPDEETLDISNLTPEQLGSHVSRVPLSDDIGREMLEAARYGDSDSLVVLLEVCSGCTMPSLIVSEQRQC